MAISWTAKQQQVIESRNRNLLVSAAAGSGKTAVLVERIIRMISEGEDPLDIDELLVMTFTKAAAEEMRERVLTAVDEKLLKDPENSHLQIQAAMIPYAQITTIDSFCLGIIREYYNKIDIAPAFRVGDEGELLLLRRDVMKKMLEDYYEEEDEQFEQFVETYATGKADHGIEDYINQVYTFSQSNPWPNQWIAACEQELEECEPEELEKLPWMQYLMNDVALLAEELCIQIEEAIAVCKEDDGPEPYIPMLTSDLHLLETIGKAESYKNLNERLQKSSFDRLAAVRSKEIDQEKKTFVTGIRDRVKKAVGKLREQYCFESVDQVIADIQGTKEAVGMLLRLSKEYEQRYQEAKREKNVVDFNDLEHYALQILLTEEDGKQKPSEVADELSRRYEEILVDEYQDSNDVQEALINSISRERFGKPNVFMVGDVKQSIYKFRLARPELFLHKYDEYSEEESLYQKIELHQNFRSRDRVLTGINEVFYQIMTKNLGNIRYTKDAALHPGASFEPVEGRADEIPELLFINTNGELMKQLDDEAADYTNREMEAKMIAAKIRDMTDPENGLLIWDKKAKSYRVAHYGDMVILLRSLSGWAEDFVNVLGNEGIPAYAERKTGYFSAIEVETVLSVLTIIDNPMQDIPLAAVMTSPIVGITDEELAYVMAGYKKTAKKGQDCGLYAAWQLYMKKGEDTDLNRKLCQLEAQLEKYRDKASYLSIHELIYEVYRDTGYYDYISSMPAGDVRAANLDMLVEKAAAYEKTSYTGLFHFIRYITNLKKFDTDFGEASLAGEEDTVRIMSIHKSKGLEFPIVFLAGLGKKFNKQDAYGKILIDPNLGIGTDYLDLERRLKSPTLKKNVLRRCLELDSMGEELRVLYVAMTRAKEKLVMTATDRYLDKKLERYREISRIDGQIPFTILSTADSYLDWLLMSLSGKMTDEDTPNMFVREVSVTDLVGQEIERQVEKKLAKEELLHLDINQVYDEAYGEKLQIALNYEYPHKADIGLYTKLSVSELKKQGQMVDEEESDRLSSLLPIHTLERGKGGAFRGTAYHRILELLDFQELHSEAAVGEAIESCKAKKRIDEESAALVEPRSIWNFLNSSLGKRMGRAQKEGKLYKEQQFVIGIPAKEMGISDSEELVLIQGIIDAYFEEEGKLILVDYKTDYIQKGQEEILMDRYEVQLEYYQRALEQMTGKKVSEKVLYSLTLQKEVRKGEKSL